MSPRIPDTRNLLLAAALSILMEEDGVLTLVAVSRKAGVSKGGLIHHFPTKEALVEAVVGALVKRFANIAPASLECVMGTPEEAEAYVEGSLDPVIREATADIARGLCRLYGSEFRKDASFLDPWRKMFAERLDHLRGGQDRRAFARAAIVTLTIESFTLIDVFNLYDFTAEEIEAIKEELLNRP